MKKNIGKTDRIIRLILGIVIIALGVIYKSWWGILGVVSIFTAVTSFCGLYTLLGINTCRIDKK